MKTKNTIFVVLPKRLKEDLDKIKFERPNHKNKAIKFIAKILRENLKDNYDSLRFRTFAKNYFIRSGYASRYKSEFLDLLVEKGILEKNNSFSYKEHRSKAYRINESYFSGNIEYSSTSYSNPSHLSTDTILLSTVSIYDSVPYLWRKTEPVALQQSRLNISLTKKARDLGIEAFPFSEMLRKRRKKGKNCASYNETIKKEDLYDMIDSLSIDYNRILSLTNEVVSKISYKDFNIGQEVDGVAFEVYNRIFGTTQWMTKDGAIRTAQKIGATLIQEKDKSRYYIDDLDRYIETKKKNILISYNTSVTALRKRIYSVNRNSTNYRLDTVFTSMCSHTLGIIKEDNNLVEIDLVNSQYAIFANWLMKQDCYKNADVKLFCSLAVNGGLYEYIYENLGLESNLEDEDKRKKEQRKKAKRIMMVVAFSSSKYNSILKTQFKELFPNVYKFISDYNKSNGGRFAVCLQNKESRIFIDGLMGILIRKGYFVLTKHDSVLIRQPDQATALQIIQDYFEVIDFKATVNFGKQTYRNGISDTHILDQTGKEYECQALEPKEEIGYSKQKPIKEKEPNNEKPFCKWTSTEDEKKAYLNRELRKLFAELNHEEFE